MNELHVTAIVISKGEDRALIRSLEAIAQQTLPAKIIDVIIVLTSVDEGSYERVIKAQQLYESSFSVQLVVSTSETTRSWFEVRAKVTRSHVTFLCEGDLFSPDYLEILLRSVATGIVPLAQIVGCTTDGHYLLDSPYNRKVLQAGEPAITEPWRHKEFLFELVGKLIPGGWLTDSLFDYATQRDNLLFNVALGLSQNYSFSKFPAAMGATYRACSSVCFDENSASDVSERERSISTLVKLNEIGATSGDKSNRGRILSTAVAGQLQTIARTAGVKEYASILQEASASGLVQVPSEALDDSVTTLCIVANFAPYAGTAGIVAAKRVINNGRPVDLISSVIDSRRRQESDLRLTESYIRKHEIVTPGIRGTSDKDIRCFIEAGLEAFETWITQGAQYQEMYSRAMVPHSHFLAAAIKRENPGIKWIAEFSDPLSLTVDGKSRRAMFHDSDVANVFAGWGSFDQQSILLSETSIFKWAELLAYFFADELIFTNQNQLTSMLEHAPISYRDSIFKKAVVRHHPTLPRRYYELISPKWVKNHERITLAYFGDFHATRGMGEVIDALENLTDEELRRLNLVIFTDSKRSSIHDKFPTRVMDITTVQSRISYLEFLATLDRMNVLIVNDSYTKEYYPQNPYLPSKVSDYRGSTTPVWAIVEPDSVLSTMNFSYRSSLGDVAGATAIIRAILKGVSLQL